MTVNYYKNENGIQQPVNVLDGKKTFDTYYTVGTRTNVIAYEWTKDAPTEEGWYWAFEDGDDEPVCLNVMITPSGLPLAVRSIHAVSEFSNWLGPLPVPELPE